MKTEYHEVSLTHITKFWMDFGMRDKNWEVVSIDPVKDTVVYRRYVFDDVLPTIMEEE